VTDSLNVELVRSIYASWERGDFSSSEWAHPEIEIVLADGLEPGRWTGWAAARGAFDGFLSTWEGYRVEVEEFRELDDERVLVLARRSGRAKISGLELEQIRTEWATLLHIHGGEVTRFVVYTDRERAIADLGLAPKAG
jgi:ketosteroid isomerase-like protein